MQGDIKVLVEVTNQKGRQLEDLKADIEKAKIEKWNARQIHEYILINAGIDVDPDISSLLDDRFNIMTPEEKETRRKRLLEKLESNISIGKPTIELAVRSCLACLEVFEGLGVEFYNFIHNYKPAAALRNAAVTVIESSVVMYGSKEALAATYTASLKAIDDALEAARRCRSHSIVSVDMQKLLETGSANIDRKLKLIVSEDRKQLKELATAPPPLAQISGEIGGGIEGSIQ